MKRKQSEILAFLLNFLWPGLGFYFSGALHHRNWLRILGVGLILVFVFLSIPSLRYGIDGSSLFLSLAIAVIFGLFGAAIEREIGKKE